MLIMETIGKIRRLYYVEGKGYKTIARELRLSKNTVRHRQVVCESWEVSLR